MFPDRIVALALAVQVHVEAGDGGKSITGQRGVPRDVVVIDAAWLLAGGLLRALFADPKTARALRIMFAVAIVAAVVWSLAKTA